MNNLTSPIWLEAKRLRVAARDRGGVVGLTHGFYRYPARFSPQFAAAVIEQFTELGDLVLDPFAGGGTTIVEGLARGRVVIGNDINSLAVFVSRVKTTPQMQLEPRVSRSEAASSKRPVRVVPGSVRNWIAVNAVQQSSLNRKMKTKNMTTLHLRNSISRSTLKGQ